MKFVAELNDVSFRYPFGEAPALKDISLHLAEGEAVYCAGLSGRGKSTLIRLLNGLAWHHYQGEFTGAITVNGGNHLKKSLKTIAGEVGTLFQNPDNQFFALTPGDDFLLTMECNGFSKDEALKKLNFWTEHLALAKVIGQRVDTLSSGEKQKVILAEMLTLSPRLLLLDEPSANLDQASARELSGHLKQLKSMGIALLIVDHRRDWLDDWIDRAIIIDHGSLVWEGPFDKLNECKLESKLGLRPHRERAENDSPKRPSLERKNGPTELVHIDSLSFNYKKQPEIFSNFSASLLSGLVTALTGANGSGKTTLMRLLSGLLKPSSGSVTFNGSISKPSKRLAASSLAMQNADRQLVMQTVLAELMEAGSTKFKDAATAMEELAFWNLDALSFRHPQSLSGGEKQRLVLACAMARSFTMLALDEPTSGLDGRNMNLVAQAIKKKAESSNTTLLITHDQDLIDRTADFELRLA